MRRFAFCLTVLAIGACAPRAGVDATPAAPAPAAAAVPRADLAIKWVGESAEFEAAAIQVFRLATAHVEREAASRARGSWAVSLDADETVISNLQYQIERDRQRLGFTSESWNAWVRRREATPIPGAAAFLSRVRELGGRIAIVTNRLGSECADTEAVFQTYALVYDVMLCRPNGTPSDKNPRFAAVASGQAFGVSGPVAVVAFVGDNILDFPALSQAIRGDAAAFAEFGGRFFVVPNPLYGSWQ